MKIHGCEQGTKEWLDLRKGIPTASEASKLVSSTGKISTQIEGYSEILAAEFAGAESEFFETHDMKMGKIREPIARAEYSLDFGPVKEIGFITDDSETCGYSPDSGVLKGDEVIAGIEIKCRKLKNFLEIKKSQKPVIADKPQIQFGLWITGWNYIDQIWYYPGLPIHVQRFTPDIMFHNLLAQQVKLVLEMRDEFLNKYLSPKSVGSSETKIEF